MVAKILWELQSSPILQYKDLRERTHYLMAMVRRLSNLSFPRLTRKKFWVFQWRLLSDILLDQENILPTSLHFLSIWSIQMGLRSNLSQKACHIKIKPYSLYLKSQIRFTFKFTPRFKKHLKEKWLNLLELNFFKMMKW